MYKILSIIVLILTLIVSSIITYVSISYKNNKKKIKIKS